ncbi:hypothetical protein [Pleomorphovibrio marinus]|uniref:hypothetical protein n=1 Tax=Pleomorphovibrio marinus TaxID=2164132 RepID=UPI000E09FD43|nr:hypothetical protein [Pleomorphovibrio marinus]
MITPIYQPNSQLKRREFMKLSALLASAFMLPPFAFGKSQLPNENWPDTSHNYLTPLVLMDCVSRLGLGSGFIQASLKHCISPDIRFIVPGNSFRLGGLVPYGLEEILSSLEKTKEKWNSGAQSQMDAQRMALMAGALCHQAVTKELQKANTFDQKSPSGNLENKIYQDGTVIREYLTSGKEMDKADQEALHSLFREMLPRTFVRFHTIMPDDEDGAGWVNKTAKWREQTDTYFGELAKAIAQPDPSKQEKYINSPNFIDGKEPIVQRVSYFSKISELSPKEAERLIEGSKDGSAFGSALAMGYSTLKEMNAYLSGGQSLEKWMSKL